MQATELESKYWREVLRRGHGSALRGHDEITGSCHNGNFLGLIELLSKVDPFLATLCKNMEIKGVEAHHICHIVFVIN